MSDQSLLLIGCAVTFIAVAGAYVYIRESFTLREQELEKQRRAAQPRKLRETGS